MFGGWHWQNGLNSCATGSASALGELTFGRVVGRTIDPDGTAGGAPATTEYFVYDTTSGALAPLDPRVGAFPSALTPAEDYGQIVLRMDASGNPTHRYLWAPGVDRIIADEEVNTGAAEDIVWTLTDHQNSVRDLARYTTATGLTTVEEHIDYDAHSKPLSPSGVDAVLGSTGRLYDEATGLRDHDQRWYDVATARWLSQDPIAFAAGDANLYRYFGNDPVNGVDPTGLYEEYTVTILVGHGNLIVEKAAVLREEGQGRHAKAFVIGIGCVSRDKSKNYDINDTLRSEHHSVPPKATQNPGETRLMPILPPTVWSGMENKNFHNDKLTKLLKQEPSGRGGLSEAP